MTQKDREHNARILIHVLGMSVANGKIIVRGDPDEAQERGLLEYAREIEEILCAPKIVSFLPVRRCADE